MRGMPLALVASPRATSPLSSMVSAFAKTRTSTIGQMFPPSRLAARFRTRRIGSVIFAISISSDFFNIVYRLLFVKSYVTSIRDSLWQNEMRVGFVNGTRMFPTARQKLEVEKSGVGRLYEASAGETIIEVINGIRSRNTLVIAGLYALGSKRKDVLWALEELGKKKIKVERARDGRTADAGSASWIIEDLAAIAGEARVGSYEEASERGHLGGRPVKKKPMTKKEALAIWKRQDMNGAEKAAEIGLSVRQLYRWLGETGKPRGSRMSRTK